MILPILALIGAVTSITDGDTFRMGTTAIRLAGIDANELHGGCHNACARMPATASRDQLAALILGKTVTCEPTGKSYRRVVGWCAIGGMDLSCWQVRTGGAVRWARYDPKGLLVRCER